MPEKKYSMDTLARFIKAYQMYCGENLTFNQAEAKLTQLREEMIVYLSAVEPDMVAAMGECITYYEEEEASERE